MNSSDESKNELRAADAPQKDSPNDEGQPKHAPLVTGALKPDDPLAHEDPVQSQAQATRQEDFEVKQIYLDEAGELAQDMIEIAARDVERGQLEELRLARMKAGKPETFYSDLIFTLTNVRYEEKEARVLWVNLLTHKMEMAARLERNVGVRVAALDYFRNILGAMDDVKIVDASAFIETAQLAVTDGLTNVFNHRYFQDRLLRDINRAAEENRCVSLLMIDIDYFKLYNDINGHIAGDVALKEVAAILRRNLKRQDLVARYGGEEFAVILYGLNAEAARLVAERIRKVVMEMEFPNEKVLPGGMLTISIGLAEFPTDAKDRGALIGAADRALYIAKNTGKNKVALAPSDQRRERRYPLNLPVKFNLSEQGQAGSIDGQISNMSVGGLCIFTKCEVKTGQVLSMKLEGFPEERPLLGRVVWVNPLSNDSYQLGMKLVNVGPADVELIMRLIGE